MHATNGYRPGYSSSHIGDDVFSNQVKAWLELSNEFKKWQDDKNCVYSDYTKGYQNVWMNAIELVLIGLEF